jgi:hypothetical protein
MSVHRTITIEGGESYIRRELRNLYRHHNPNPLSDARFWIGAASGAAVLAVAIAACVLLGGFI